MNPVFIKACEEEIKSNSKKKGPWVDWKPSRNEIIKELMWHVAKLNHAVFENDHKSIQEFSADVANYCEKIYRMSQLHESQRKMEYDHYGCSMGTYSNDWKEK